MATYDLTNLRKAMSYASDFAKNEHLHMCICCVTVGFYDGRGLGTRTAHPDEFKRIRDAVNELEVISPASFSLAMGDDWEGSCRTAKFVLEAVQKLLIQADPGAEILNGV